MDKCKAALCVEIQETLGFEGSNIAFSPKFGPDALAELERLCSGLCDTCPVLEVAKTMSAKRHGIDGLKKDKPLN